MTSDVSGVNGTCRQRRTRPSMSLHGNADAVRGLPCYRILHFLNDAVRHFLNLGVFRVLRFCSSY